MKGYLDSLSFVKMLTLLEEVFDMRIAMEDLDIDNFETVEDIALFVRRRKEVRV